MHGYPARPLPLNLPDRGEVQLPLGMWMGDGRCADSEGLAVHEISH